jgi:hypothetical protein
MKRSRIAWGLILILLGAGFLVYQLFPDVFAGLSWPWLLLAVGGIFVVMSLLTRTGGTLIPGLVLLGVGGILLYQTSTGNWASWSYLWPLMPGLVGLGLLLGSVIDPEMRPARGVGIVMLAASLALGAIFAGLFGLSPQILRFWPVLLIVVGAIVFFRAMRPRHE